MIGRDASAAQIREHASTYPRVVLALLGQDADSHVPLSALRAAFAATVFDWRMSATRSHCGTQQARPAWR